MPDIMVGGEWRSAIGGGRREIRCPADGSLVGEVDEATGADTEAAIEAAHDAFHHGPWPHTSARERGDLLLRLADLLERDKAAIARAEALDTGKRLVEAEYDVDDVVARLPLLRPRRRRGRRPDRRHRQRRRGQPDRPRADRRLRADHAVELPAAPDVLEGRTLPGGRQHVRAQAERDHPPHRHPAHAPARPRPASRTVSATWFWAPGPRPAHRSPPTLASTWSRSPEACPPVAA